MKKKMTIVVILVLVLIVGLFFYRNTLHFVRFKFIEAKEGKLMFKAFGKTHEFDVDESGKIDDGVEHKNWVVKLDGNGDGLVKISAFKTKNGKPLVSSYTTLKVASL